MSENRNYQVARLDEIERRNRDIPVREHLGIHAFGVNAYTAGEDGTLIGEHDEADSGQEELYLVLEGNATFEIDGETVDAPAGTLVCVGPESKRKATGDGTVLAVGATPGEEPTDEQVAEMDRRVRAGMQAELDRLRDDRRNRL